ncbi:MAG: methylated-DNA--[protein]-cysteine S-methyltransferase [Rikenellaceae bacterium]|nr:methylated-DNA--[protein]-cysteine S-methyltransferase [Rikenellaceae bacterium]
MNYICEYDSPIGRLTMASDGEALTGLWFDGQRYFADTLSGRSVIKRLPLFGQTAEWLDCYFNGKEPDFTPALRPAGSPFRLAVWDMLRTIPYGETVTYKDIAVKIARLRGVATMSAQAVGGAVGHNPVSIIIPCHRVVGCGGSLTGYAGGIDRKVSLLKMERVDMSGLFVP